MNEVSIATMKRNTADEAVTYDSFVSRAGRRLDLRELINAQVRDNEKFKKVDSSAVDLWHEQSELVRQRTGEAPSGLWVPLNSLSRDLTIANSPAAITGTMGNKGTHALLPRSAILGGGATVLAGLKGSSHALPTVDQSIDASSGWVDEGAAAAQLEPSFTTAVLEPHSLTAQVIISRRLLANSSFDLDTFLRAELVQRLSLAIDLAAVNGSGSAGQPLCLLNTSGLDLLQAGTNGGAPTWGHLVDLEHRVMSRVGDGAISPTWLMSPTLAKKLRKTARVSGGPDFLLEARDLLGYPVRVSPNVPDNLTKGTSEEVCSALVFGDLAEVVVGFWTALAVDLLVDPYTMAKDGKVRLVARAEVGIVPRRIGAFAAYKDLLSA